MKYAVISLGGKQHVVTEGETLRVNRQEANPDEDIAIKDVLLVVDGDKRSIGSPLVEGATVHAKVLAHERGEKIRVAKFKAKSRYRKVQGHRQELTAIQIVTIA